MKTKIIVAAIFGGIVLGSASALAAGNVAVSELGPDAAILPGNPFYGFVKLGSGFRKFFVNNDVEEALFQLEAMGRKAVEFKKIHDFGSRNKIFLLQALEGYENSADIFYQALAKVSGTDLSGSKAKTVRESTLALLTSRLSAHLRFVDHIRGEFSGKEHDEYLKDLEDSLSNALLYVPENLEDEADFEVRMGAVVQEVAGKGELEGLIRVLSSLAFRDIDESDAMILFSAKRSSVWDRLLETAKEISGQQAQEL